MKRFFCISLILGFFLMPVFAEHEKEFHVKNIRGECTITDDMDISAKAAAEMAFNDAKKKAIAEISTSKVKSWDMIASGAEGENYNSVNMVSVDGKIVKITRRKDSKEINPVRQKETTYYCEIDAIVRQGGQPDPDFDVSIKGIKGNYKVDDQGMSFTVLSSKDAYLKVFIFENEQVGTKLYPSEYEPAFQLKANQEYTFPSKKNTYYELFTDKPVETDIMVFVLTKTECPYLKEETNRQEIEEWMAKIDNDQIFVFYRSINIFNE